MLDDQKENNQVLPDVKKKKKVIEVQSRYLQTPSANASLSTTTTNVPSTARKNQLNNPRLSTSTTTNASLSLSSSSSTAMKAMMMAKNTPGNTSIQRRSSVVVNSRYVTPVAPRRHSTVATPTSTAPTSRSYQQPQFTQSQAPSTVRKPSLGNIMLSSAATTTVKRPDPYALAASSKMALQSSRKPAPRTARKPSISGPPTQNRYAFTPHANKAPQTPGYPLTGGYSGHSLFTSEPEEFAVEQQRQQQQTNAALLSDEILMNQTRVLQWAFVNAKFDDSFEKQSAHAQAQFLSAWSYIEQEQRSVFEKEATSNAKQRQQDLSKALEARNREVGALGRCFGEFQQGYSAFAQAVGETASKMPVKNIIVRDPDELATLLGECELILRDLDSLEKTRVTEFSKTMGSLAVSVQEVNQEFVECCELIKQIEEAEKLERSLNIQKLQRKK